MIQGKIERLNQSFKNQILLRNHQPPSELVRRIAEWVEHHNTKHYHESLNIVTPADAYFGRARNTLKKRMISKRKKLELRRCHRQFAAA